MKVGVGVGFQVKGVVVVVVVVVSLLSVVTLIVGLLVGLEVNTWAVGLGVTTLATDFSILSISLPMTFGGFLGKPPFTGINPKLLKELMVFSLMKVGY